MISDLWGSRQKKILKQFQKDGVIFKGKVFIEENVSLNLHSRFFETQKGKIVVGNNSKFSKGFTCDTYGGEVVIGDDVFFGPYCVIYGHGNVTIGDNCLIAMGCKIVAANHSVPSRDKLINKQEDIKLPIFIGNDVWLGADVKVLAGVTIGDGCVIGAGSVVTKSIPSYSYAVGMPAVVIKERN